MTAVVKYVDGNIAQLVTQLKNKNMWKDTIFLFTADNGGQVTDETGGNNWPLRGGKSTQWEGGVRVAAFLSGGFIPMAVRGTKLSEMIHIADWYTTFITLAGGNPIDDRAAQAGLPPVDGLDMWPLITGKTDTSPRTEIPITENVLIQGRYKLLIGTIGSQQWTGPVFPNKTKIKYFTQYPCGTGCLFDVVSDPTEHNDLRYAQPQLVQQLTARLNQIKGNFIGKKIVSKDAPSYYPGLTDSKNICQMSKTIYGGAMGPWRNITVDFLKSLKN